MGTTFKDGATVYVKVWDGENNGSRTQPRVTNLNTNTFIDFYVYDDGTNLDNGTGGDGQYKGSFIIRSSNAGNVGELNASDGDILQIRASIDTNLSDAGYFNITADYTPPNITSCHLNTSTNASWLGINDSFTVTLTGESNGTAWFSYNSMNVNMSYTGNGTYSGTWVVHANESHNGTVVCYHADEAGNEANT